jgi:hypothetical protein
VIGRIITCDHTAWQLPPALAWSILRTGGVPCDSFSFTCVYTPDMADTLHRAVSFLALEGDRLLLHGFVDEYEISQTAAGRSVTLTGRGYAGRLLDNESRPLTYQTATLAEILRNHVTPYGVTCGKAADLRAGSAYTVAAGTSQWKVLESFCRTYGGFVPRFLADGQLIAAPEDGGRTLHIGDEADLLALRKRENHYGVLSEVLVIDKTRNVSYSVQNRDFSDRGGQCRRVLYTPGQSTWAAMRYTGEYQIARSREDEVCIEVTLPGTADAEPGDTAVLRRSDCGLAGTYRVSAAEFSLSESGETTTLTLKEKQ